jgi:predicted TIM-barrel fold metal-dependent hydrolase
MLGSRLPHPDKASAVLLVRSKPLARRPSTVESDSRSAQGPGVAWNAPALEVGDAANTLYGACARSWLCAFVRMRNVNVSREERNAVEKLAKRLKVVDVDTHIIEPYDLWTSRLGQKWDLLPHVERVDSVPPQFASRAMTKPGDDVWIMGTRDLTDKPDLPVGVYGMAGYHNALPDHPATIEEVDPAGYDPHERLKRMDEYGLWAQMLYPNIGGFGASGFLSLENAELKADCVRAYNDFMHEWCSADPKRLIALAAMPFWDLDLAVAEAERCFNMGHKGIVFTWQPEGFGQPHLADPYWNPLWQKCTDWDLPINFHVGSGVVTPPSALNYPDNGFAANFAKDNVRASLSLAPAIMEIMNSKITQRFPNIKFVVVESGVGWIPFVIENLTWLWGTSGTLKERPDLAQTSPLEIFQRNIWGTFWFEDKCVELAVDYLGADHIMFETDFPHPTSVAPGPNTFAENPIEHIQKRFADSRMGPEAVEKILSGNARKLYRLDD